MRAGDKITPEIKNIKVKDQQGEEVSLGELLSTAGKYLVLYFYPKDNTPGCTAQACSYRDYNDELEKLGAKVVGVSKDSPKSHQKFISGKNLNFTLLADEGTKLHQAFGVWVEKSMFGKKYMGAERSTFLLNAEGEILQSWHKVKPGDDAKNVYEFLKK